MRPIDDGEKVQSDGGAREGILLIALAVAIGVTGPKLYRMAQIKGWVSGGIVVQRHITQKGIDPAKRLRDEDSYWVSWEWGEVGTSWERRERVSREVWEKMQLGDPIELVHFPGDPQLHLRNGVFVEEGNFVFDWVLLALELTVAVVMLVQIILRYRQSRKSPGLARPVDPQ